VGVYEAGGRYQLYVDQMTPAGLGALYRQFELLKARLDAEGLFAPERKRPLPQFPRLIGVVTSPDAAAFRDVVKVLSRRYPLGHVLLSPTLVQGEAAPKQIVGALDSLNARDDVDVIIVTRGGGSLEDLWAFNDEQVARSIAFSRVPVVCGVGHETDFSLADFASDVRAPTPSAAAEMVAPDCADLRVQVAGLASALVSAIEGIVDEHRWTLTGPARALRHLSPDAKLAQDRQRVDGLQERVLAALRHDLGLYRERVDGLLAQMRGVSPFGTLKRGYAIVLHQETGHIVRSIRQVVSGDGLSVQVSDGEFDAEVTD
jgi:exodeoxyribonuclease VII large subunit